MKNSNLLRNILPLLLISLLSMVTAFTLHANPNRWNGGPNHGSSSAYLLEQAYAKLNGADHYYEGHRVHAMKLVKEAIYKTGGSITESNASGHESQGNSDEQFKAARELLTNARVQLARQPLRHIDDAIAEIDIALSIK